MRFGSSSSPSTTLPHTFYSNAHPALLTGHPSTLCPPLRSLMEIPPIPRGNQALAAAISRGSTPRLQEPPSPSPSGQTSPPLAFLAEIFTETRDSLQLNPDLVQDISPLSLQSITAGQGSILSIVCASVSGIIAITTQLNTVTTQLWEIRKENQQLRSNLHDLASKVANESATHQDIGPIHSVLRDLSHRMTTTPLPARPTAPIAPPKCLPAGGHPPPAPPTRPHGPPFPPHPEPLPTHPHWPNPLPATPDTLDPSAHSPFDDTTLKKMFGNPELYAKGFRHSWEAEQFRTRQADLSIFTLCILHSDYARKTSTPTYAQAAGSGPAKMKQVTKRTSGMEVA